MGLGVSGYLEGITVAEPIVIGNKQSQQISVMGLIKRLLHAALAARVEGVINIKRPHSSKRKCCGVMGCPFPRRAWYSFCLDKKLRPLIAAKSELGE